MDPPHKNERVTKSRTPDHVSIKSLIFFKFASRESLATILKRESCGPAWHGGNVISRFHFARNFFLLESTVWDRLRLHYCSSRLNFVFYLSRIFGFQSQCATYHMHMHRNNQIPEPVFLGFCRIFSFARNWFLIKTRYRKDLCSALFILAGQHLFTLSRKNYK